MKLYEFEGALRSVREVNEMVPCLSNHTIRIYLRGGVKTIKGMTSMDKSQVRGVRAAEVLALVGDWDSN